MDASDVPESVQPVMLPLTSHPHAQHVRQLQQPTQPLLVPLSQLPPHMQSHSVPTQFSVSQGHHQQMLPMQFYAPSDTGSQMLLQPAQSMAQFSQYAAPVQQPQHHQSAGYPQQQQQMQPMLMQVRWPLTFVANTQVRNELSLGLFSLLLVTSTPKRRAGSSSTLATCTRNSSQQVGTLAFLARR